MNRKFLLAAMLVAAAGSVVLTPMMTAAFEKSSPASSVVRIVLDRGHGSGVHIGDGYILTAAHVVDGEKAVSIKLDSDEIRKVAVLWANKEYDVALLRLEKKDGVAKSELSCRVAMRGEDVRVYGSPLSLNFIVTHGRIAGLPSKTHSFTSVYPITAPIAPGSSGGPLLDSLDKVIGIATAMQMMPIGFGGATAVGINYAVPSSAICMLMGKRT